MTDDTIAKLNEARIAAYDALFAGDLSTAMTIALGAQLLIGTLPAAERSSGKTTGTRKVEWPQDGIDQFITNIRRQINVTTGIQVSNIVDRRPGPPTGYWDQ